MGHRDSRSLWRVNGHPWSHVINSLHTFILTLNFSHSFPPGLHTSQCLHLFIYIVQMDVRHQMVTEEGTYRENSLRDSILRWFLTGWASRGLRGCTVSGIPRNGQRPYSSPWIINPSCLVLTKSRETFQLHHIYWQRKEFERGNKSFQECGQCL